MRVLSVFLAMAACAAITVHGAITKEQQNTPGDYLPLNPTNYDYSCLLKSLTFTNGLNIIPGLTSNNFHYSCSCATFETLISSSANVLTYEDKSIVELNVNGVDVNTRAQHNSISNFGDIADAPMVGVSNSFPIKDGNNQITLGVTANANCYYQYNITCYKPPSSFVVGDPQFVGLRGQSYQVHGVAGEVYNIISDRDLQYNSKFVFLDQGECPVINGKKAKGCWSHSGSYLGELGLKTRGGDKIHIQTGSAKQGFVAVELNGKQLEIGETIELKEKMGSISLNSTHEVAITIGVWQFNFENSDMFVNQRVKVADARNLKSHGLLGQTWRTTTYPNQQIKYVQGAVDDYAIRDSDLFGDNFVYNTFN